jgi:FkbM family methyltransferase
MELMQQLQQVKRLATSGKAMRAWHHPLRYLNAMAFLKMVYPRTHKGVFKKAKTFFGQTMELLLPAATDIYLTGGKTHDSEIRLAAYMIRTIQPGQVYIDVGAHFGYYTLLAAKLAGANGKVYAFEAANNTFGVLHKNVAGQQHIKGIHNAVSDVDETISFYEFPVLYSEYNSMNVGQFENEVWISKYQPTKTEVKAVRLDDFISKEQVIPTFIKIDVEGAEDKVISGGLQMLKTHAPIVVMEFLSQERLNGPHHKATAMLKELGYDTYIINKEGYPEPVGEIGSYFAGNGIESDNIVFIKNKTSN